MRVLILTNGEYGNYNFCHLEEPFDYIICADRGMMHANRLGIRPDLIVGDFDSAEYADLNYFEAQHVRVERYSTHKDETDTEIAIDKAISLGASEVFIYGGLGTRFDHTLANVHLLYKLLKVGIQGVLVNPYNKVYLVKDYLKIKGSIGQLVSLLPFMGDVKGVTTTYLEYALNEGTLEMGTALGISNVMQQEEAEVVVREGILIVILAQDE